MNIQRVKSALALIVQWPRDTKARLESLIKDGLTREDQSMENDAVSVRLFRSG